MQSIMIPVSLKKERDRETERDSESKEWKQKYNIHRSKTVYTIT